MRWVADSLMYIYVTFVFVFPLADLSGPGHNHEQGDARGAPTGASSSHRLRLAARPMDRGGLSAPLVAHRECRVRFIAVLRSP